MAQNLYNLSKTREFRALPPILAIATFIAFIISSSNPPCVVLQLDAGFQSFHRDHGLLAELLFLSRI